jgi:predicted nucleotidyltransferase
MAVIGVVCEYNPFHRGHLLHLQRCREALGEESTVLCVMSGDFVQRGEAALYDKFARAEAACRCGADLVIELPLPWCLSSAEGFARGAVSLLHALGASHLGFGSESGEIEPLRELARTLREPGLTEEIKARMARESRLSFAAAREAAARERLGDAAGLLRNPNDILAVEYLKAAEELASDLEPLPILRVGAGHDRAREGEGPCSASELRERIRAGESVAGEIPAAAEAVYRREREAGRELAERSALEIALLSRLRMLGREDFRALPDAGDGLGDRLWRAVQEENGLEEILAAAKSKRYALSRLRRTVLCAALGLRSGERGELPPYARVLAFDGRGRELLRGLDESGPVPVLTKPAQVRKLSPRCEEVFSLGAAAHDLYVLGRSAGERRAPGEDWRRGPWIQAE